jgi:hypothetical protein
MPIPTQKVPVRKPTHGRKNLKKKVIYSEAGFSRLKIKLPIDLYRLSLFLLFLLPHVGAHYACSEHTGGPVNSAARHGPGVRRRKLPLLPGESGLKLGWTDDRERGRTHRKTCRRETTNGRGIGGMVEQNARLKGTHRVQSKMLNQA